MTFMGFGLPLVVLAMLIALLFGFLRRARPVDPAARDEALRQAERRIEAIERDAGLHD